MCAILKTKFFQCNEDIQYQGEIRLVDDKQRLLGFYDILDARKKSQDLEMDLVLINDKSRPAICKMMNYKDSLFKQFAREILQTDM
jgi:translation initiation factor IF-3